MERYGDFFPENPQTLDELLEVDGPAHGGHAGDAQLDDARAAGAAPAARPSSCSRTWTCAGRWTSSASTCAAVPADGLGPRYDFEGQDPLGFAEAMRA